MINNYIYLLLGAIAISFAPIMVKLSDLSSGSVGFYRNIIGFLAIYIYACFQQKKLILLQPKKIGLALLAGLIFCGDLYAWHESIHIVGAGLGTVLANTQIFFAAIWSHFFFKEKIPRSFLIWASLAIIGLYLLCVPNIGTELSANYLLGCALGIGAGALYSGFLSCIKIWQQKFPEDPKFYPVLWISLFTGLWFPAVDGFKVDAIDGTNILWMLILGLGVHAGGWILISKAIEKINFSKVSLGLLLQPILASLIAYFLFAEKLNLTQCLGLCICLFAIYKGQNSLQKKQ